MRIKSKLAKFAPLFQTAMVVLIASLFVVSIVYAATTISANIVTGGNLTVTGRSTTTSATSSEYLMVGYEFTMPPTGFDYSEDFAVSGNAVIAGDATITDSLWIGGGAAVGNLDMGSGDLYVQNDAEIDGASYFTGLLTGARVTSTSATSSSYLMVGYEFTIPTGFDYSEDLAVSGTTLLNGVATATTALWVGTGIPEGLDMTGGDLYVQGDVHIDGNIISATTTDSLKVGGYATVTGDLIVGGGTFDLNTSTATTTSGIFSRGGFNGTSTVSIGDTSSTEGTQPGCLEMVREDAYHKCWIDAAATGIECQVGRCRDGIANLDP